MYQQKTRDDTRTLSIDRRSFVQGLAAGGATAAINWGGLPVFGETQSRPPDILTGTHFELAIDYLPVNFTGHRRVATAVNGSLPGPTLRWREGDLVTLAVTNHLKEPTSIHWHGVRVPPEMDGVPGVSFAGIQPGETFVYRIPVRQSGTYWYHSHSGAQEQLGLSGALIIDPKNGETVRHDREYVVLLTDWTDAKPDSIFSNLKQDSEYYNFHQRTAGTFLTDVKEKGLGPTITNRRMWGAYEYDTDRHLRRNRIDLYLSSERKHPIRQLDWAFQRRRTSTSSFHQWICNDLL